MVPGVADFIHNHSTATAMLLESTLLCFAGKRFYRRLADFEQKVQRLVLFMHRMLLQWRRLKAGPDANPDLVHDQFDGAIYRTRT
jgi:hypothetical protein